MRSLFACLAVVLAVTGAVAQKEDPQKDNEPPPEGRVSLALDAGMHTGTIVRVFFRAGDKQLVTLGTDHAVRLWDVGGGRTSKVIYPPGFGGPRAAALSRDGNRLAVATRYLDGGKEVPVIYVMSLPGGEVEHVLRRTEPKAKPATVLAFSPDGKTLASANNDNWPDGHIRLWPLTAKSASKVIRLKNDGRTNALAFSPDGKRLAWINRVSGAILDTATGEKVAPLPGGVYAAWSADGTTLATADRELKRSDAEGKPIAAPKTTPRASHTLAFGPDAKTLLWNDAVVDAETGEEAPFEAMVKGSRSNDAAFSSDGKLVASVGKTPNLHNYVLVRDARSGKAQTRILGGTWFTGGGAYIVGRWSADGKAVCWRPPSFANAKDREARMGTFRLDTLELAPTLGKAESSPGRTREMGDRTLKPISGNQNGFDLLKGGDKVATLPGGYATFAGKDLVALITQYGRWGISLFDAETGKPSRRISTRQIHNNTLVPSPDGRYLLTLHSDQTLCVWKVGEDTPLLTLSKHGPEWVVWTKEGYYAASPGGEGLVGWKVDNGIVAMPSHYPAERFKKRLHRPDVIRKAFELGSVAKALAALDGKEAKPAELEKLLPPKGSVRVIKQDGAAVTVEATAEAQAKGQPVVALRLMLDGRPFPDLEAEEFEPGKEKASKTWTVQVPEGVHRLHVLARSEDASAHSEPVTVRHLVAAKQPTLHLLAVGIDDYANGIPKLKCAVNDAKQIAKAFPAVEEGGLFKKCLVHPLTDKEATVKNITDRLAKLRADVKREDVVVVFFAGHGAREGREFYLLTAESDIKKLDDKTALSGKTLSRELGGMRCQVLLLLDACHSGAVADRLRGGGDEAARGVSDDEVGVVVLAAAQGHQEALEKDGNGYFTSAIKEALAGDARVPRNRRDGRLYVHNLYSHVMDVVGERSDFKQTPFLKAPARVQPFALRQFDLEK